MRHEPRRSARSRRRPRRRARCAATTGTPWCRGHSSRSSSSAFRAHHAVAPLRDARGRRRAAAPSRRRWWRRFVSSIRGRAAAIGAARLHLVSRAGRRAAGCGWRRAVVRQLRAIVASWTCRVAMVGRRRRTLPPCSRPRRRRVCRGRARRPQALLPAPRRDNRALRSRHRRSSRRALRRRRRRRGHDRRPRATRRRSCPVAYGDPVPGEEAQRRDASSCRGRRSWISARRPKPVPDDAAAVRAEVLMSEDGMPRGIRFVDRAPPPRSRPAGRGGAPASALEGDCSRDHRNHTRRDVDRRAGAWRRRERARGLRPRGPARAARRS